MKEEFDSSQEVALLRIRLYYIVVVVYVNVNVVSRKGNTPADTLIVIIF